MLIPEGDNTPMVNFDADASQLQLRGRCVPADATGFFAPIIAAVRDHRPRDQRFLIDVKLDYFNTSSAKNLLDLFKTAEQLLKKDIVTRIVWHYLEGDEDLMESGQDYAALISLPFDLVEDTAPARNK
jgi:hypothetical protein